MDPEITSLSKRDQQVIWHPYTQHKQMRPLLPIVKAQGVYLFDENNNRYIDAISSWWTNIHGHSHPYIAQKIYQQALQLEHIIFAGCTHEPAVQLAERILPLLPGQFSKIFYSDNGSTAVEVALKMAIQYWKNQEPPTSKTFARKKILALKNAYHGDTFGAMSISDRGVFTLAFQDYLFDVIFIEPGAAIPSLPFEEISCFIYEPLVQGAGGMNIYSAGWLNELICRLKQNSIICIADEVMTGFGRTGQLFASSFLHHTPDIICLSKGLTGGTLPLSITACTTQIFDAFLSDNAQHTFFHGHSYTANPLACAAGLASLDLLQKDECIDQIEMITKANKLFAEKLSLNKKTTNVRSKGTILAFELLTAKNNYLSNLKEKVINTSLAAGVFLRPLGNTVYLMPPYCIGPDELKKVYDVMEKIIEEA